MITEENRERARMIQEAEWEAEYQQRLRRLGRLEVALWTATAVLCLILFVVAVWWPHLGAH